MKKITIAAATTALIFAVGFTQADAGSRGDDRGNRDTMKMLKQLDLSDDQKSQIKSIFKSSRQETASKERMSAKHELMRLDPAANDYDAQVAKLADQAAERARAIVLRAAETKTKIAAVLTDEQKAELKQKMQERHAKRMEHLERKLEKMKANQR